MPGPGGGGRSGGGGRGFGGGGFGGGGRGFGGGMHHGPHHGPHHRPYHRPYHRPHPRPFMGGWFGGPRYYGGGCLNGVMGIVFAIVIVVVVLLGTLGSTIMEIVNGGSVTYDEAALQAYADRQYAEAFAGTAYEDNMLLVFLTDDNGYDYAYIAWVGDHVDAQIRDMLGDYSTDLGQAMESYISDTDYTYSLDTDLARVIKGIGQKIHALNLESSHTCREENPDAQSLLINHTNLPITEETVNQALTQFAQLTGIPCTIVVEDAEAVFGRSMSVFSIVILVLAALMVLIIVVNMVKKRRNVSTDENYRRNDGYQDPY